MQTLTRKISGIFVAIIIFLVMMPLHAKAEVTQTLPAGGIVWVGDNTVYYENQQYLTLSDALKAVYQSDPKEKTAVVYCKPEADVGKMTHGHVADSITIYGNGANVSGGEYDMEIDTYRFNRDSGAQDANSGSDLEKDITVTVHDLNGIAAWGERKTGHTINLVFDNCNNMNRVYFAGTTGKLNVVMTNCSFEGSNNNTSIYSNSQGTIQLNGCEFKEIAVPINLNNKSNGIQMISVENCRFVDCSTTKLSSQTQSETYAAPIRVVAQTGARSELTVKNVQIAMRDNRLNGDILIGDGRSGKTANGICTLNAENLSVEKSFAEIQIQQGNYYAENGTVSDAAKMEKTLLYPCHQKAVADATKVFAVQNVNLEKVDKVEPTCTESGHETYWKCSICMKLFADENSITETTLQDVTIPPKGHTVTKVDVKDATCTKPGNVEYWHCDTCGKNYSDQAATQELSNVTVPPTGHEMTKNPAVAATTEKEGNLEYYVCENEKENDAWYWDAAGNNLIENHNAVVTAKLTSQTENVKSDVVEPAKEQTVTGQTESGAEVQLKVEIDTETLKENTVDTVVAVDNTSDDLKEKAVNELKKTGADVSKDNVDVVLTPAVEIKNVQVNETDATITMNISLVCKAEAKVNGKVVLEETTEVPNDQIKQDTVITMSVPASWNGKSIIVRHETMDRGVKFYSAVAANGVATFTVPAEYGFSPFTLFVDDGKTVTVKLDNETKTYNRTDVVNETALPAPGKFNYAFKGWKFEGIDGQYFNMTAELFEALLDKNAVVIGSSVFEGPMSEHPEIEEAKKNGTWGVDENKPAATAKPAAAAVTPVRTSSIPKTSDDSNLMLWVCLMGIAALGLGGAVYMKKRNHQ